MLQLHNMETEKQQVDYLPGQKKENSKIESNVIFQKS